MKNIETKKSKLFFITNPILGISICYLPSLGRKTMYRQPDFKRHKGMKLLTYKTKKGAQTALDRANEVSGGGYIISELINNNIP